MAEVETVKSIHSECQVKATFTNASERNVDMYWVDFQGRLVRYFTNLSPGKQEKFYTYVTHPWVARDCATGQRMFLSGQPVYVPTLPNDDDQLEEDPDLGQIASLEVTIHIPVFRLEEICIGFFRKHLSAEDMSELEVNHYITERIRNIPKPSARVYHVDQGIIDE